MRIRPHTLVVRNVFHHYPGDNAAAIVTLPAIAGNIWVIDWIHASYDDATTVGTLLIEVDADITGTTGAVAPIHDSTEVTTVITVTVAKFYPELVGKIFTFDAAGSYLIVEHLTETTIKVSGDASGEGTDKAYTIDDAVYTTDIVLATASNNYMAELFFPEGLAGAMDKKMVITLSDPGSGKAAKLNVGAR